MRLGICFFLGALCAFSQITNVPGGTGGGAPSGAAGGVLTGTYPNPGIAASLATNSATATALAANGMNCSAGNYPLGVDASGNAETCTGLSTGAKTSQGTTTTVYHGNAGGDGAFGAVALATDVSGTLPQANVDAAVPHCYKGSAAVSGANMSVTDAITGGVTNTALAAATTQNLTLFTLPAQGKVVALSIKPSTIFAGGAISELTMSVGPASCSNAGSAGVAQCYAPSVTSGTVQAATGAAYGLFTAVANTNMFDVGGLSSSTFTSHAVQVQFTSTGGNMSALTAGAVDIRACIVTLP